MNKREIYETAMAKLAKETKPVYEGAKTREYDITEHDFRRYVHPFNWIVGKICKNVSHLYKDDFVVSLMSTNINHPYYIAVSKDYDEDNNEYYKCILEVRKELADENKDIYEKLKEIKNYFRHTKEFENCISQKYIINFNYNYKLDTELYNFTVEKIAEHNEQLSSVNTEEFKPTKTFKIEQHK